MEVHWASALVEPDVAGNCDSRLGYKGRELEEVAESALEVELVPLDHQRQYETLSTNQYKTRRHTWRLRRGPQSCLSYRGRCRLLCRSLDRR